jgi:hypothetical protein
MKKSLAIIALLALLGSGPAMAHGGGASVRHFQPGFEWQINLPFWGWHHDHGHDHHTHRHEYRSHHGRHERHGHRHERDHRHGGGRPHR